MSIGEGAKAVLVENGETDVVYQYGGYTLNDPAHREYALDGKITILQQCFAGDLKKTASLFSRGWIQVENCSNCWHTTDDEYHIDIMACKLIWHLFGIYSEKREIPADVFLYY